MKNNLLFQSGLHSLSESEYEKSTFKKNQNSCFIDFFFVLCCHNLKIPKFPLMAVFFGNKKFDVLSCRLMLFNNTIS